MADGDYGKIEGSVTINGAPAERNLVAVTFAPQDTGLVDDQDNPILARKVVGEGVSAEDGTYTLTLPGFWEETIVIALDNYGDVWKPNRSYAVDDRIRPTLGNETGYVYVCTIAGVSDPTEPTWWIDDGGSNTGSVGTATFQAVEAWWPVAHAPIMPTFVNGTDTLYPLEVDPYIDDVATNLSLIETNLTVDSVAGNTWTINGSPAATAPPTPINSNAPQTAAYFNGSTDFLSLPDTENFNLGSGDFTIEAWTRVNASNTNFQTIITQRGSASSQYAFTTFMYQAKPFIGVSNSGSAVALQFSGAPMIIGEWTHVAFVRSGDTLSIYQNGVLTASDTFTGSMFNSNQPIKVGASDTTNSSKFAGYLSGVRVTRAARYLADFTPSVEPWPTTRFAPGREPTILDPYFPSVTLLLLGGETGSDIVDSSSLGHTPTKIGAVSYDASTLYFDESTILFSGAGALQYVGIEYGDVFTVELFFKQLATTGTQYYLSNRAANTGREFVLYQVNGGGLILWIDGTNRVTLAAPSVGVWHHLALTYDGTEFVVWLDGVEHGSYSIAPAAVKTSFVLGGYYLGSNFFNGHVTGARITQDTVRYTAPFTIPAEKFVAMEYDPFEDLSGE